MNGVNRSIGVTASPLSCFLQAVGERFQCCCDGAEFVDIHDADSEFPPVAGNIVRVNLVAGIAVAPSINGTCPGRRLLTQRELKKKK